jgi:hypothetical protein
VKAFYIIIMKPLTQEILDLAVRIQQIPAPTFSEADRAEFVRDRFIELGLSGIEIDDLSNVYAVFLARVPAAAHRSS